MLLTVGYPRSPRGSSFTAYKKTWMMAMVGHLQVLLLLGAILSFVPLGITLIVLPWNNLFHLRSPNNQITYFLAYVICICLVTMLWVTTLSAVMTFDDIFKTVAGMYQAGHDLSNTSQQTSSQPTEERRSMNPLIRGGSRLFKGANLILGPMSPSRRSFGIARPSNAQSPRSPRSPGSLRPQTRFTPSSIESVGEKMASNDDFDLEAGGSTEEGGNRLTVIHQTVITVEDADGTSPLDEPHSIPMHPHPYTALQAPPSQYRSLSRTASRT